MKTLTAEEMRAVDRQTIERGLPGQLLMENAGCRVVDFLLETFTPLTNHHVLIVCGKGNNGGDGFVIARQLFTRKLCRKLTVVDLAGAGDGRRILEATGCPVADHLDPNTPATLIIDAILGTGLRGPAEGISLQAIQILNQGFPLAHRVAVDIPSGLPSDTTEPTGEFFRTDYTVSFTAAKRSQVLSPIYQQVGNLRIYPIGSPEDLLASCQLNLSTPEDFRSLFAPRPKNSNKGMYGHVLVIGGSYGKSGAPAMASTAAYRSGAGLVTVGVPAAALPMVASYRPELMTEPLHEDSIFTLAAKMSVAAIGPGLGTEAETVRLARRLYSELEIPAVIDADALNAIAGNVPPANGKTRILTPHPGEMSRLTGRSTKDVQAHRLEIAQSFSAITGTVVVLKGDRTIIAFPDGETWINPTGSPSMATGGTGDILTGMIAGCLAQHSHNWRRAVVAAVWLHGRSGELAAKRLGEQCTLATDLLDSLPEAMDELRPV